MGLLGFQNLPVSCVLNRKSTPGPPRSTISGRSKNHISKTLVYARDRPEIVDFGDLGGGDYNETVLQPNLRNHYAFQTTARKLQQKLHLQDARRFLTSHLASLGSRLHFLLQVIPLQAPLLHHVQKVS